MSKEETKLVRIKLNAATPLAMPAAELLTLLMAAHQVGVRDGKKSIEQMGAYYMSCIAETISEGSILVVANAGAQVETEEIMPGNKTVN